MLSEHNSQVMATRIDPDPRWTAVLSRDRRADGRFFYAVTSTGVFCRPSCPSRRPRPDRVRYFDSPAAAEAAGFRPCRRCRPTAAPAERDPAASAVRRAAAYLSAHATETISLGRLAQMVQLSPSHLQRQFTRVVGLSPREYQAALRSDRFRQELRAGRDVAAATYEAGYGSPSRVYDAPPTGRGMSPATYRRGGAGVEIGYVTVRCALGWVLIAATERGLCAVSLGDDPAALAAGLSREFPKANLVRDGVVPREWVTAVLDHARGDAAGTALPLDVRGTAFQWKVWRALQAIPRGETRSYGEVARSIGHPSAARAVAGACARNSVGLVVPCHRVVGSSGEIGGYRWGRDRKHRLLTREKKRSRIPPE